MAIFKNTTQTTPPLTTFSSPIERELAEQYMTNYTSHPLDLKNQSGIPIKGFYFDASDFKQLVANLHNQNGAVYIGLAKKTNDSTIDDYTLVACATAEHVDGVNMQYVHHPEFNPWFEFCKPCPNQCPIW
jgi:hypothetical protein